MVTIELIDLEFFAYHGVYEEEQHQGNNFIVNLQVSGDFIAAVDTDSLKGTVDYESLYEIISEEMQVSSKLLEHVAGRILKRIFNGHPEIKEITVGVEKLNPPMDGNCKATRVTVSNNR